MAISRVKNDEHEQAAAILRAALREHPEDVFGNLRYLSLYRAKGHDDIIAAYRSAMATHEDDPRFELFYAASLIGTDTPEALRRLTGLASADFPYPYLLIGEIHSFPAFEDRAAATTSLARFVKACPSYLPGYELLSYLGSGDDLKTIAEQLRKVLGGRTDTEAVAAYRWLWSIEFRVAPPASHAALRLQVEKDIADLGLSKALDNPVAVATLRAGYGITGDDAALKSLPPPPSSRAPVYQTSRQWEKEHPFPQANATKDEKQAFYRASEQAARSWIATWPDEPLPYSRHFSALAELPETSEADLVAAGEKLIAINRKHPGRFLTTPAVIYVARAYVARGIRLDEVPGMVDTGLREAETTQPAPESDLSDDRNHRMNQEFRYASRIEARQVQFDWAIKTYHFDNAHQALAAMRKDVDGLLAVTAILGRYPQILDADYWTKMAQLADLEGKPQDAAEYRRAAKNADLAPSPTGPMPGSASAAGKTLPPFRVNGIDGRVWTEADLHGKIAVMNVWATWCGPCIQELPHVQKLYEMLKDRPNVLLVSLNVDGNAGLVAPFLKGRGLNFPVLLAKEYVDRILPEMGIPRNWIVESGVVRSEDVGFDNAETWMKHMLATVDEALQRH